MNGRAGALPLRARTVTDILDAAVGLYRHNFGTLLAVVALVHGPLLALQVLGGGLWTWGMLEGTAGGLPGWAMVMAGMAGMAVLGAYYLGALLLGPLSAGAVALAVSDLYLGRPVTVRGAYRGAASSWLHLFLAQLIIQFGMGLVALAVGLPLVVLGAAALVMSPVVGIVVLVVGSLAVLAVLMAGLLLLLAAIPAIVVERRTALDSIVRSFKLVRGGWRRALAAYALLGLLVAGPILASYGLLFGAQAVGGPDPGGMALTNALLGGVVSLMALLVMPITMAGQVVIYYDLRVRQEGLDLEMMAADLELGPQASAGPKPTPPLRPVVATPRPPPPAPPPPAPPPVEKHSSP
jgi:hypothetical protein